MSRTLWYAGATIILLLAGANVWLAQRNKNAAPIRLVVVTTHPLPGYHKITVDDLRIAVRRVEDASGFLARPSEATGACTLVPIAENQIVDWRKLVPAGQGDGICASSALALDIVRRATQNHPPPTASPATPGSPSVAPLSQWLDVSGGLPPELSPEAASALGEFRAEFMKEFAKHIADNAADHIFGRDRKDVNEKEPAKQPAPQIVLPPPSASGIELQTAVYFDSGQSALDRRQRDALTRFAASVERHSECKTTVVPFTDRPGSARTQ